MKKESLGDKYKKALKRIKYLEGINKKNEIIVADLCQLVINQDKMLGKMNMEMQEMKSDIEKDAVFDGYNENTIKYI